MVELEIRMNDVITNPSYSLFMELCSNASESIKLCAPYVKTGVIKDICVHKKMETTISLITRVNLRDYHSKVSDIEALERTLQIGGNVFNCSNLHAKAYIFDSRHCIITSANLTSAGLIRNAELGFLTDRSDITTSVIDFYSNTIAREDVGKITEQNVEEISELLMRIPPVLPIVYPRLDLSSTSDSNLLAISEGLSGWKRDVFLSLGQFDETFTTAEVGIIAQQLGEKYPRNNYREAKVRQVLQQLRDLGLIEFSSPGIYKKLWV